MRQLAQPYLPGVKSDPQPDRGQRSPLQGQRTCDCVGRPGECDDETVTFALLDRAHAVMRGHQFGQCAVEVGESAVISSGTVSQSGVEPCASASSSVTVPVGTKSLMPASLHPAGDTSTRGRISLMLLRVAGELGQNISVCA